MVLLNLVVLGVVVLRLENGQVAEGELAQCFGVMGRQHQAEVIDAGRRWRCRWQSLRHLAMHVATEDERDRLTSRMTFPVHVQARQILWIEAPGPHGDANPQFLGMSLCCLCPQTPEKRSHSGTLDWKGYQPLG